MRQLLVTLAFILVAGDDCQAGELPARAPIRHSLYLDGRDGRAPLIGCPGDDAGLRLGRKIARVLHEQFGADADVMPASQIGEQHYRDRTVLLLGHIVNNAEILWLYSYNYCFADAAYPSGSGYVIRQVYDPIGAGRNALVIGASSPAGLKLGVERFNRELSSLDAPLWTQRLILESDLQILRKPPGTLDPAAASDLRKEVLANLRKGRLWNESHRIIQAAQLWYLTHFPGYLDQYRAMVAAHSDFTAGGLDQIYGGLEFWLPAYVQAWDIVEESDSWSARERQQMAELLLALTKILAERYGIHPAGRPGIPRPRWNHETNPAMAYFFLAAYLRKYYDDASPAPAYRAAADQILGDQLHFVRGTDESASYLPYAPAHALRYAFATRDNTFATSGRARRLGDLLLMMTDNTGRFVGSGNQRRKNIAYYCLLPLATVLQDGHYVGLDEKSRLAAAQPTVSLNDWGLPKRFGEYRPPLSPVLPRSQGDVHVARLESGLFELTNSEPFYPNTPVVRSAVDPARAFDKLVFRDGFQAPDHYLMLDGYGRGRHLRYDTNAIVRFSSNGRVFLVETDDDQRIDEKFQNTLTVIRDGRGQPHVPPYAELELAVDLADTGFSRSKVFGYAGLDWTRNVLWLKGSSFAVWDEVEAIQPGEYNLRCHWNGLGELNIDGRTIRLRQEGHSCAITCASPIQVLAEAEQTHREPIWDGYPHCQPAIQRIRQLRSQVMKTGDRSSFQNVIYAYSNTQPRQIECRPTATGGLLLDEEGRRSLLFIDPAAADLETDARMGLVEVDRIVLVRATYLRCRGQELLRCSGVVDIEWKLSRSTATVSAASTGTLALSGAGPYRLRRDKQIFTWPPPPGLTAHLGSKINSLGEVGVAAAAAATAPQPPTRLVVTETRQAPEILAARALPGAPAGEQLLALATPNACRGIRIDADGRSHRLWEIAADSPVTALVSWQTSNGQQAVVSGSASGVVTAVDLQGRRLWRHQLSGDTELERRVSCLAAGDVDRDGHHEVVVGTHSWNVHCLSAGGEQRWVQPAYAHRIASLSLGDINGDGADEILAGTSYYLLNVFNGQGDIYFACRADPVWRRTLVCDLDRDGLPEIAAANGNEIMLFDIQQARLRAQTNSKTVTRPRATQERFRFHTGDDVTALQTANLDAESTLELVGGSASGFVYHLDAQGNLQGMKNVAHAVGLLIVGRRASGLPVVVAALQNGDLLLLDQRLTTVGVGRLSEPAIWLRMSDDGHKVWFATEHSVGVVAADD